MNLLELRNRYRTRVDDREEPQLWSDEDADAFINEACREAAVRARLFRDETTPSICQVPLVAGQTRYVLDPRVIEVIHARINGERDDLNRNVSGAFRGWQYGTGCADEYAIVREGASLVLVIDRTPPDPPATITRIDLVVYRLPMNDMVDDTDPCELPVELQFSMLDWAAVLSFESPNSDKTDTKRRDDAEARFTAKFGERESADVYRKKLRHKAPSWGGNASRLGALRRGYHPSVNDPE